MAKKKNLLYFTCTCGMNSAAAWKRYFLSRKGRWVAPVCPKCHKREDLRDREIIECPGCHKLILKGVKSCPECHHPMTISTTQQAIPCPQCGVSLYLPENYKDNFTCPHCDAFIDQNYIRDMMKEHILVKAPPRLITLPTEAQMIGDKLIIYQYPDHNFSYKSQLKVSEGTWGLLLVNGEEQCPLTPGAHPLEKSHLSLAQRFDAAAEGENPVFHMDVFCIRRTLPALKFFYCHELNCAATDEAPASVYDLSIGGKVTFNVFDAGLFMSHVGHRPLNESAMDAPVDASKPVGQIKSIQISMVKKAVPEACDEQFDFGIDSAHFSHQRNEFESLLNDKFNEYLQQYGLEVNTLLIDQYDIQETDDSIAARETHQHKLKRREELKDTAKTEILWRRNNVELHLLNRPQLAAYVDFFGSCRLQIIDEAVFFATPEVKDFLACNTSARQYFESKIDRLLQHALSSVAQQYINEDRLSDLQDKSTYTILSAPVNDTLNALLEAEGLRVSALTTAVQEVVLSSALKDHLELSLRKKALRRYAEQQLLLTSDPIQVHKKDDMNVFAQASFSGSIELLVVDQERFFASSDVDGFLFSKPFVSEMDVRQHYTKKIQPIFSDAVSRAAQDIIDRTNIDIRQLNLINHQLHDSIVTSLQNRISIYGLSLRLNMREPIIVGYSNTADM